MKSHAQSMLVRAQDIARQECRYLTKVEGEEIRFEYEKLVPKLDSSRLLVVMPKGVSCRIVKTLMEENFPHHFDVWFQKSGSYHFDEEGISK